MARRHDIEPGWDRFKERGADGDFYYWPREQRRAYRAKQMAERLDACRREEPMGDRIVFRCNHEEYGCSCGGRFVFWHVDQEGSVTLRDAEGDHRRFSKSRIAKREKTGLRQRHTQSELREIRAAVIRDIHAGKVRQGYGRRADILRLIQERSGRSFDRARDMLDELVEGGHLAPKTYSVLKMPEHKWGISKVSIHHGREQRALEAARRLGITRSSARENPCELREEQPVERRDVFGGVSNSECKGVRREFPHCARAKRPPRPKAEGPRSAQKEEIHPRPRERVRPRDVTERGTLGDLRSPSVSTSEARSRVRTARRRRGWMNSPIVPATRTRSGQPSDDKEENP